MKIANARASWFQSSGNRLDASFHISEGRQAKLAVELAPNGHKLLSEVTQRIFNGSRFKRFYVDDAEKGIPFMGNADMMKADFNSLKLISKKKSRNQKELFIESNWTLISCSGTIGNTVYSNEEFVGKTASQHIMRVVPNTSVLPAGYLFAFLSSRFGHALLTQGTYGAVIQHIEPHHIADLPVPLLPNDTMTDIDRQVRRAGELRVEAAKLLREAEARLLELLAIEPARYQELISHTERDTAQAFAVNSREVGSLTLRARNYSRRLQGIIAELSRHNPSRLAEVLQMDPYYGGRFKRIASRAATAVELLSQGDLFLQQPKGLFISTKSAANFEKITARKGTTLIPGAGTLGENEIFGRARFVWGYLENKLVAEHVVRFEADERKIDSGYLFAVLSSRLWFRIFRSSVYGTSLLGYLIPMLNEMPIPRFSADDEKAIGTKVKAAYECLTTANELETTAIRTVETHIGQWQPS